MMNYSETVIDHFERPRNVLQPGNVERGQGRAGSKAAGVVVEFQLDLDSDGLISHVGFRAWGCPYTIAVASWLTEHLPGQTPGSACNLDLDRVATELGLPAEKWHCVLTAEDALRSAAGELKL